MILVSALKHGKNSIQMTLQQTLKTDVYLKFIFYYLYLYPIKLTNKRNMSKITYELYITNWFDSCVK